MVHARSVLTLGIYPFFAKWEPMWLHLYLSRDDYFDLYISFCFLIFVFCFFVFGYLFCVCIRKMQACQFLLICLLHELIFNRYVFIIVSRPQGVYVLRQDLKPQNWKFSLWKRLVTTPESSKNLCSLSLWHYCKSNISSLKFHQPWSDELC